MTRKRIKHSRTGGQQQYIERLAVLHNMDQALLAAQSPERVAAVALPFLRRLVACQRASVTLIDQSTDELEIVAVDTDTIATHLRPGIRLPLERSFTDLPTLASGQVVYIADVAASAQQLPVLQRLSAEGIQSIVNIPLLYQQELIGVLNMASTQPHLFTAEHLQIAQEVAVPLALALQQARQQAQEREQLRRLQESQALLVQAEKLSALGRLTASMAHEINNPIQAIQGCLTLAQEDIAAGKTLADIQFYLDIVQAELTRVATLIQRLRDFYRPVNDSWQPTDLRLELTEVLELAGKQLQQHYITVACNLDAPIPAIYANRQQLRQLFLNLILNAADAIPRGGQLRISAALDQLPGPDGGRPAARIEFNNDGPPITHEVMSHLFEPFFTTKEQGTGLGLFVSYGIVEAHGGRILVDSQPESGTTFTVLLPLTGETRPVLEAT